MLNYHEILLFRDNNNRRAFDIYDRKKAHRKERFSSSRMICNYVERHDVTRFPETKGDHPHHCSYARH